MDESIQMRTNPPIKLWRKNPHIANTMDESIPMRTNPLVKMWRKNPHTAKAIDESIQKRTNPLMKNVEEESSYNEINEYKIQLPRTNPRSNNIRPYYCVKTYDCTIIVRCGRWENSKTAKYVEGKC